MADQQVSPSIAAANAKSAVTPPQVTVSATYLQRLEDYAAKLEAEAVTLWKAHEVVVASAIAFVAGFGVGGLIF
jgi:hypothetical protein